MSDSTSQVDDAVSPTWQQGELVDIDIDDLTDQGDGVGRWCNRVIFVPDTVPGDRVRVRLVRVKRHYAFAKLSDLITPSPHRCRPACIVADKCGGCQWQHLDYDYQLLAKQNLVSQALSRIGQFVDPPVHPTLSAPSQTGYRNKATYPLRRSGIGVVQAGYYQKGSHQIINLNQCPIQDQRLNPLLSEIKQDIQQRGWSIYDETTHRGKLRHLALRVGRRTGEQLLTLVSTSAGLAGLDQQAQAWLDRYPNLVGVVLNLNPQQTNTVFGPTTQCVAGRAYLEEIFANLRFQIQPTTFFQVFTEQAEQMVNLILKHVKPRGDEWVVDAYCGIGTLTLPLATRVREILGLEIQAESVAQAQQNARLNHIDNATFQAGAIEACLPALSSSPDIVVLDPPRKGCDPVVIQTLCQLQPQHLVYVSCNPATLARDLKVLCGQGGYQLSQVQPVDFFPQTSHVESVAFLQRSGV